MERRRGEDPAGSTSRRATFIDGSNPDAWTFPVGTRVWKEFRFARRAETRLIERTRAGWQYATYAWNDEETEATLVPEGGVRYSVPIRDGVRHGIPSRVDCRACHEAGPERLLGVTALQLSPDRDPNAPHAEPPPAGAIDLTALVSRGLLRGTPARVLDSPPRIAAASPAERAALGYLHSNCGSCHAGTGELRSLGVRAQLHAEPAAGRTRTGAGDLARPAEPVQGAGR